MTRVQEILRMPIGVFLMVLLVGIPHVPVRPLELPEDFAQEGDAVQAAIQENARFQERHQPPNLSENRVAYWNMETGRWEVVRARGQVRIPTDLGYLTYPATAGSAYRVETVTAMRPILQEPEYVAPELLETARSLSGYREAKEPFLDGDELTPAGRRTNRIVLSIVVPMFAILGAVAASEEASANPGMSGSYYYAGISGGAGVGFIFVSPLVAGMARIVRRWSIANALTENQELLSMENQRRQHQARESHNVEVRRIRNENQSNRASDRDSVIVVHDVANSTTEMVWYGDPRLRTE
jgi:hypothetical protein